MKILVTGAAGFIGSHLAEHLAQRGHHVIGIDNFDGYYADDIKRYNARQIVQAGVELVEADLAADNLSDYVTGVEAIYHGAAQPGISGTATFQHYVRNNIIATQRLLDTVQDSPGLQLFLNVGTSSIYGGMAIGSEDVAPQPISNYGVTKLAAEQLVLARFRETGFPCASFRLFSVYGPRERPDKLYPRVINSIIDGIPFPLFADSWEHKRAFTYIQDVITAFEHALDNTQILGEVINIGTTKTLTTGEAIRITEEIADAKATYVQKPRRPGDQQHTAAVIDKAQRLLGYAPSTPFSEGIRAEIEWFQSMPVDLRRYYAAVGMK